MDSVVAYKAYLVGFWFVLIFIAERVAPQVPYPPATGDGADDGRWGWRRLLRHAGLWVVNTIASPLIVLPATLWAATVSPWEMPWRTEAFGAWGLVIDFLILDLFLYWWHRLAHRTPLLWRFHAVHHVDPHLDASSAVRFHVGEVMFSALARVVVILAFGIPFEAVILFEAAVLIAAIFHHANIAMPPAMDRALSFLIVTPGWHRQHHRPDKDYLDSHFGTVLTVWDRIFRTDPGGLADRSGYGVPGDRESGIVTLLLRPFVKSATPPNDRVEFPRQTEQFDA